MRAAGIEPARLSPKDLLEVCTLPWLGRETDSPLYKISKIAIHSAQVEKAFSTAVRIRQVSPPDR
jgi:hypothetical protein